MRQFANPRRDVAVLLVVLAALVAATGVGGQQRQGAPFSTAIMKIKEGLYVTRTATFPPVAAPS